MATSAFKSTTKRTPIGSSAATVEDAGSTNRSSVHRRSRSLSRFSRPMPSSPACEDFDDAPAPRGRFVNTVRGSGFPEISLDDLAVEFFGSADRGRSAGRNSEPSSGSGPTASQRRGRSVSRHTSKTNDMGRDGKGSAGSISSGTRMASNGNLRRRRSVSVVRCQISDSESDLDHSQSSGSHSNQKNYGSRNSQTPVSRKPAASNPRPALRRSVSHKNLKAFDGYSSHSSALTDDEGRDAYISNNGVEKTIRAIYAKKAEHPTGDDDNGGLYEAMRRELRHAVEEIREEIEQAVARKKSSVSAKSNGLPCNNSDALHSASLTRRNNSTRLGLPEKHKQGSLSEIVLEEQLGRELSNIQKTSLPDSRNTVPNKPSRVSKRNNDKSRMSKRLTEEAERYIEDFISNVEDTDISSIDGERSDTSSTVGGIAKPETFQSPVASKSASAEMDGVLLPWLQWETGNDASSLLCTERTEPPVTPITAPWNATPDVKSAPLGNYSASSQGSWCPGVTADRSKSFAEDMGNMFVKAGNLENPACLDEPRESRFDMEEHLQLQSREEFLLERWRQQHRISSGSLLLCNGMFH